MRSLNPDHLKTLTEVVQLESFTRAAKRLNLSQPAVSLQIRELEARLGVRLVDRMGKRAYATAAGRELIDHARRINSEMETALASMRRHKEGWLGRVRLGASTTALIYHLAPVLQRLRLEQPNIDLLVTSGTTSAVVERILRNEIDLGVVSLPVVERMVEVTPLKEERLVAIFPAGMPDIPDEITPADFAQLTLILEHARAHVKMLIIDWLSRSGFEPRPAMELDNMEAVKRMVAAGLGASIIPAGAIGDVARDADIAVRELCPPLSRTLALVRRRNKPEDTALRRVREAILKLRDAPASERA